MTDDRTPDAIANRLVESWLFNPDMWATHGVPPDHKLLQIARDVSEEIAVDRRYAGAETRALILKARALVDLLDDAERNHGALIGSKTLRAVNELRLELNAFKEIK